jgi:hypothetical protein
MTDDNSHDRRQADDELKQAQDDVDEQLKTVHRLEAQGQDDTAAQQKLELLLEKLEAAQQKQRAARGGG